jgi:hypothetical protein
MNGIGGTNNMPSFGGVNNQNSKIGETPFVESSDGFSQVNLSNDQGDALSGLSNALGKTAWK